MGNKTSKRLTLNRETLRRLGSAALRGVAGVGALTGVICPTFDGATCGCLTDYGCPSNTCVDSMCGRVCTSTCPTVPSCPAATC